MLHDSCDTERIQLWGSFVAHDDEGNEVPVQRIEIDAQSYCCDVHVVLEHRHESNLRLAEDASFLAAVHQALLAAGYPGREFGRAEWGLQSSHCIVLESTEEFQRWAMSKGWRYEKGQDAWDAQALMHQLPPNAHVAFKARDGSLRGIPLWWLVQRRIEALASAHGSATAALRDSILPQLRKDPLAAAQWARELPWEQVEPMVRVLEEPAATALAEDFSRANLLLWNMGLERWRRLTDS